jgi:hypothetical protein
MQTKNFLHLAQGIGMLKCNSFQDLCNEVIQKGDVITGPFIMNGLR